MVDPGQKMALSKFIKEINSARNTLYPTFVKNSPGQNKR